MSPLRAALLALALALPAGAQSTDPLELRPEALPRSAEGAWSEWSPEAGVPDEHRGVLSAAMSAYFDRDYPLAVGLFHRLLVREPDFPPALYQLATTYFRLRRYGDCRELMERFLEVAPGEVGATQALGHCLYTLGDYPAARDHYRRVLAENPESVEATRGLALSHMRLGELERALELLDRVVAMRPTHAEAHSWRARVLYDLDRSEDARGAAERALELDPFLPPAWYLLSQVLFDLGEDERAEEAAARFDELTVLTQEVRAQEATLLRDPYDARPLVRLVHLHRTMGNLAGARFALERALAIAPDDPSLRMLALDTLEVLGDDAGAEAAAEELERRCDGEPAVWQRLQRYWGQVGNRTKQVQAGERYLRLLDELARKRAEDRQ